MPGSFQEKLAKVHSLKIREGCLIKCSSKHCFESKQFGKQEEHIFIIDSKRVHREAKLPLKDFQKYIKAREYISREKYN